MANDLFQADPSDAVVDKKFEDLVGEGKPYADQDAVAKALVEKDRFIEQLKRESAEARQAATTRLNEDQFLDKLEQRLQKQASPQVAPQEDPAGQSANTGLKPEDVQRMLEERDTVKRREANLSAVAERLKGVYGSNWKAQIATVAGQLGVGTQWLTNLAAESPAFFFNSIGLKDEQPLAPEVAPPRSQISSFTPPASSAKDYAYWQAQKAEKGEHWYFSTNVQQQIWKTVKEMGEEKFYARSGY